MEHPANLDVFSESDPESDEWIRLLELHDIVKPIGAPDDPCKVIALNEDLWSSDRLQPHSWARHREQRIHGSQRKDTLQHPAEFIEELKRRYRSERSGTVQFGDITVPIDLAHIVTSVEQARLRVLGGSADPEDDEEIYQEETLQRASSFLLKAALSFWRSGSISPPAPSISGGPDGSIDVVWRGERRTLYINVPEEPDNVVTFFGTDQRNPHLKLRGEEDPQGSSGWLLSWLCG